MEALLAICIERDIDIEIQRDIPRSDTETTEEERDVLLSHPYYCLHRLHFHQADQLLRGEEEPRGLLR